MNKTHTSLNSYLSKVKKGSILFPTDFRGMGTEGAIKMALSRLVKEGKLKRVAHSVCSNHSMARVERELALGHHDYLPVVDEATDQLIGILSASDVLRAREQARESNLAPRAKVHIVRPIRKEERPQ